MACPVHSSSLSVNILCGKYPLRDTGCIREGSFLKTQIRNPQDIHDMYHQSAQVHQHSSGWRARVLRRRRLHGARAQPRVQPIHRAQTPGLMNKRLIGWADTGCLV